MLDWSVVAAVTRAELRATRRLVRYWVFLALAWLFGIGGFLYYSAGLHRSLSAYSATIAQVGGRYFVAIYGGFYILVFLAGVVFLGFDLRTRDERARIAEVLDARPQTNLELVAGRGLGLLLAAWLPLLGAAGMIQAIGWSIGETVEPYSVVEFVVFMALPALAFGIGLAYLSSVLLRSRILVAVANLALLGGAIFGGNYLPVYLSPVVNIHGAFSLGYPSDMVHFDNLGLGALQRLGVLGVGVGLLGLAAALYPRREASSPRARFAVPALLLAGGVAATSYVVRAQWQLVQNLDRARAHHEGRGDSPVPDLDRVQAQLVLEPGRRLALDATLAFRAPATSPLERALWSFNPGLSVTSLTDASGRTLAFRHEAGLLEVDLPEPLAPGASTTLRLTASGAPETDFGYLDAVRNVFAQSSREAQLFVLGYEPSLFRRSFVALMPASRWLPASGPEVGRNDPRRRPRDYFQLELEVELPEGWLPAAVGRREELPQTAEGRSRFRFAPEGPVAEAALLAARFERRAAEIDGVDFEVLFHPAHRQNLDFFEDAAGEIRDWLAERLREARELGLAYPYGALTLAEVPNSLRTYGGGWRMDSALAAPGLLLVRESSFPTARFDVHFRDPRSFADREGGMARAKREWLERFFESDFTGGNVFVNGARNFFSEITGPYGEGAIVLEHVLQDLANRLVTGKRGYFSVHVFGPELNSVVQQVMIRWFLMQGQPGQRSIVDAAIEAIASRPTVWDALMEVPLARLDPWKDPRTALDVLVLKGDAMAQVLLDMLGRQAAGELLADLREAYRGRTFDRAAVAQRFAEVKPELEEWLALWLDRAELPAFAAESAERYRLPDTAEGEPRYQLRVVVRNEAEVAGLVRVEYFQDLGEDRSRSESTDPLLVPARSRLEFALVTPHPVQRVRVRPYISLNRGPFEVELPPLDTGRTVDRKPLALTRVLPWEPPAEDRIVVDDLDAGFRTVEPERRGWRLGGRATPSETDHGLPAAPPFFFRPPDRWSRAEAPQAWGRYRHTFAFVRGGDPERGAIFEAQLPRAGEWELELHVPLAADRRLGEGSWTVEVGEGEPRTLTFDLGASQSGWNSLGTFSLPEGLVRVTLRSDSKARVLVADAVRWRVREAGENTAHAARH